jgi:transcriptional regulator with XRE-family HTH domain
VRKYPAQHRAIVASIRDARIAAGLSQRKLAARLGEAINYVQRIESGERQLQVVEFIAIAKALKADPIDLLRSALR